MAQRAIGGRREAYGATRHSRASIIKKAIFYHDNKISPGRGLAILYEIAKTIEIIWLSR